MKVYELMETLGKLPAGDEIIVTPFAIQKPRKCDSASKDSQEEWAYNPEKMSWDEIAAIGRAGRAKEVFRLGARKTITLSDDEAVLLQIVGFDHDDLPGGGKAPISWDMVGVLSEEQRMNQSHTNAGGWEDSCMRSWVNRELFDRFPEDLKSLIKSVVKKTSTGGSDKDIVETVDKLWLLSEKEVYGRSYFSALGEGHWYDFYRQEDTSWNKREDNGEGSAANWWLRSPYVGNTSYFCFVNSNGTRYYNGASIPYGVALGFCI